MGVTKHFTLAIILITATNCAIDNTSNTIGAFNCNPSTEDITVFQSTAYQVYTLQNCITCHGSGAAYANFKTRFKLQAVNPTPTDEKNNLCISYALGQKSSDKTLVTHPLTVNHGGPRYGTSDIQVLIDWVNSYSLP